VTDLRRRYPATSRLFGAYLNQDWDEHGKDPVAALDRFREDAGPAESACAAREIRAILRRYRSEPGLAEAAEGLSLGYDPGAEGLRRWLRAAAARLERGPPP
jgi:hypothetical protein